MTHIWTSLMRQKLIFPPEETVPQYGYIAVRLTEVMEQRGMSKNKLIHRAELERTQLSGTEQWSLYIDCGLTLFKGI